MLIKVRTPTGKIVDINVKPTDTILNIKEAVQEIEVHHISRQRLVSHQKRVLTDCLTVEGCKLTEGSVIYFIRRWGCSRCSSGHV